MSLNDYFQQILPHYANSTTCRTFFQSFTEPLEHVSLRSRRRDGVLVLAGHRHGEVKFAVPLQCESLDVSTVDRDLVDGLNTALTADSQVLRRLRPALSFFNTANTDADGISIEAEVIFMASAFEQLLEAEGARELSTRMGDVFQDYGAVTVVEAMNSRVGINLDPNYADAQLNWFVHKKWVQELHQLRSTYVHGENHSARTWGWLPEEHLVIGAFIFPLLIKLLLRAEEHYTFTRGDEVRCRAVDSLLAHTDWNGAAQGRRNATNWQERLSDSRDRLRVRNAAEAHRALRNGN